MSPASVTPEIHTIALAYSGGLDTSIIVPWLKEHYPGAKVVCVAADIGQPDDLSGVEARRRSRRARRSLLCSKTSSDEFLREYAFPTLRAGAIYERKYLLGTSMARPLIARSAGRDRPARKVPTRWRMAAPARATTRSASN